jgi:hypothetical protein
LETYAGWRKPQLVRSMAYLLIGIQFVMLYFSPREQIPAPEDARAGNLLVATIAGTPGEVLVPYHGYLALMAGKAPSAHQVMLWLIRGNFGRRDEAAWARLQSQIDEAIQTRRFNRILLDKSDPIWRDVPTYYAESPVQYPDAGTFYPVTGGKARPNLDYSPK